MAVCCKWRWFCRSIDTPSPVVLFMLLVSLTAGQSSIVLFSVIAPTVPLKPCLEAIFLEYNTNYFNQETFIEFKLCSKLSAESWGTVVRKTRVPTPLAL